MEKGKMYGLAVGEGCGRLTWKVALLMSDVSRANAMARLF